MLPFSERNNLRTNIPITIRNEAKEDFREWLVNQAKRDGVAVKDILQIICQETYQCEDGNWEENYIKNEAIIKLKDCEWYFVYNVLEGLYTEIPDNSKPNFVNEVNKYFGIHGYGWKLDDNGLVQYRGLPVEENAINTAIAILEKESQTAQSELKLALHDLSIRPEADTTGTVHHAMAAIECFCKSSFSESSGTIDGIIKKHNSCFTPPLDIVLQKLWGFASEHGRHVKENCTPSFEDAELTLNICSALIVYLTQKISTI